MVAPLSQASNNSTGMSGYTSSCGSGASTSAYVGTQQLSLLPGCSSSGMGEIQRSTGSYKFGGSATFTLMADVDIHSEIHYTYWFPPAGVTWCPMVGLKMIRDVTIKVGTSVWETIDQASMLAMAQLEMTTAEYELWASGLSGLDNSPTTTNARFPAVGVMGGKLMCCIKGGYRGQLFVAAMPYQTVTVKINFSSAMSCTVNEAGTPNDDDFHFALYTKQHILSPYERGLMQSTDILQLLGTTQHYSEVIPQGVDPGKSIKPVDLSFLNDYCTHVAVWVNYDATGTHLGGASDSSSTGGNAAGESDGGNGGNALMLDKCQFVYNGASAQGQQRSSTLLYSSMLGLAGGGLGLKHSLTCDGASLNINQNPRVQVFQLANTPCVTSLSKSESQYAPFAGGDGIANNRYDVIHFKADLLHSSTTTASDYVIHFVAFGAQSVLYSAGGAVRN